MEHEKEILPWIFFFFFFLYLKLNQSLKWCFDYIIITNSKFKGKKNMEEPLDRLEFSFHHEFSRYYIKVSQVKGSFYVLVKKPRGKILGDNLKNLFNDVTYIPEKIYNKFADDSKSFRYNYFPYCKLVRCYGNYQYHLLVVKKDY